MNTARLMQSQPIGSAVNNSNSGVYAAARIASLLGNASDVPVLGPMVAAPLQSAVVRMQARGLEDLSSGLRMGAPQGERPLLPPAALAGGLLLLPSQ